MFSVSVFTVHESLNFTTRIKLRDYAAQPLQFERLCSVYVHEHSSRVHLQSDDSRVMKHAENSLLNLLLNLLLKLLLNLLLNLLLYPS